MWILQASTSANIPFGPFVSSSDGVTVVTSAISANDIKLFQGPGATGVVSKNSGAATYISNGFYYATFNSTDLSQPGLLKVFVNMTSSAALPVWFDAYVVTTSVYTALWATTTAQSLQVNVTSIGFAATAANAMSSSALATIGGQAVTGTLNNSTFSVQLDFAAATDGQMQNRQVIFDRSTATAGLRGQAAQISTWTAATSTMTVTPSLTNAPANGDTFRIF